jgi:hypothetical protein
VLVGERVQRLERPGQFGQGEIGCLERESAGPADGGGVEALVVFGLDHEQNAKRVAEPDVPELGRRRVDDREVAGLDGAPKPGVGGTVACSNVCSMWIGRRATPGLAGSSEALTTIGPVVSIDRPIRSVWRERSARDDEWTVRMVLRTGVAPEPALIAAETIVKHIDGAFSTRSGASGRGTGPVCGCAVG